MRSLLLSTLCFGIAVVSATGGDQARPFSNLVTFGDSYTDTGRLGYYINNGGKAPPAGTLPAVSNITASGGLAWGQTVSRRVGAQYFNYAVGGATCSNQIISRYFSAIDAPFPSVMDDEIPSFKADVASGALYGNRTAENTVYALWIGTNDLGAGAFLTDTQAAGTNLSTFVECIWRVFDDLYASGGRRFVLLNEAPLQLSPMYTPSFEGGSGDSQFWSSKTARNETEYQYKIMQYAVAVNTAFDYGVPFQLVIRRRWPDAAFSVLDVHRLMTEISLNPAAHLDAPANSTGVYRRCAVNGQDCVNSPHPLSSFMWYDELHPSERTESIIARHFIDVVAGNSPYGTTYH